MVLLGSGSSGAAKLSDGIHSAHKRHIGATSGHPAKPVRPDRGVGLSLRAWLFEDGDPRGSGGREEEELQPAGPGLLLHVKTARGARGIVGIGEDDSGSLDRPGADHNEAAGDPGGPGGFEAKGAGWLDGHVGEGCLQGGQGGVAVGARAGPDHRTRSDRCRSGRAGPEQ
jgi:hypothetical protein